MFYVYIHVFGLFRAVLYLAYYPSIILINKDYDEFKRKFSLAETYMIPVTDFMTFVLGILYIVICYKSNDRLTDYFELTKPTHV